MLHMYTYNNIYILYTRTRARARVCLCVCVCVYLCVRAICEMGSKKVSKSGSK